MTTVCDRPVLAPSHHAEEMIQAALGFASTHNWPVFPVTDVAADPANATIDPKQICGLWSAMPSAGIAILTGPRSGIWSLRVVGQYGKDYLAELEAKHGPLPPTATIIEPGGTRVLLFRWPADRVVPTKPKLPCIPFGVAGEGGYMLAPPSLDPLGRSIAWEVSPDEQSPAFAPSWLLDLVVGEPDVSAHVNANEPGLPTSTGLRPTAATVVECLGTAQGKPDDPKRSAEEVTHAAFHLDQPDTTVYVGDCRDVLAKLPERSIDLGFADPPFNWDVQYGEWDDARPRGEYLKFTYEWLDACIRVLKDSGSLWVNIPDDTAAEIVVHLKARGLAMVNWCVWHFRFGQWRPGNFIVSKVHALYFAKDRDNRVWNPDAILEPSDRATIYGDKRTQETKQPGMRVPLDVWYGENWGRIQGNNKERRHAHQNQLPEVYLERVIRACSNEGQLVLDPFLGSGTTCTVARGLGRRSIGIEYSEDHAASAFERIKAGPIRLAEKNSHRKRGVNGDSEGTTRKQCS